jgi:hypothetical protein
MMTSHRVHFEIIEVVDKVQVERLLERLRAVYASHLLWNCHIYASTYFPPYVARCEATIRKAPSPGAVSSVTTESEPTQRFFGSVKALCTGNTKYDRPSIIVDYKNSKLEFCDFTVDDVYRGFRF